MRKNKKCEFTVFGETLTLKEIAAKYGIKYDTLYAVHRRSKSDEKAIENAVKRLANLTAESVAGLAKSLPDGEFVKLKKLLNPAKEYTESTKHLPDFLRDFHDQKEVFKTLFKLWGESGKIQNISWVDGHIFTIDFFLEFMALHGYTLRKSMAKVDFYDLQQLLREEREDLAKKFSEILGNKKLLK